MTTYRRAIAAVTCALLWLCLTPSRPAAQGLVIGLSTDPMALKTSQDGWTFTNRDQTEIHIGFAPTSRSLVALEANGREWREKAGPLQRDSSAGFYAGTLTIYSDDRSGFFATGGVGRSSLTGSVSIGGRSYGPVEKTGLAFIGRAGYELRVGDAGFNAGASFVAGPSSVNVRHGTTSSVVTSGRSLRLFAGFNISLFR